MDTVKPTHLTTDSLPTYLWQQLVSISDSLSDLAKKQHWVVAYSGGGDSSVLAHLMHLLKRTYNLENVTLMHVHHGLQPEADEWALHCAEQARNWALNFVSEKVKVVKKPRQSVEALAREARYAALRDYCLKHRGILLLGHHLDDVMETVLLQLKRGSGPKGLAAMAEDSVFDGVRQFRPLLDVPQSILKAYLTDHALAFIDDPSNQDQAFDRNFVRHSVVPLLRERWPAISQTVARSARLCAKQDRLISQQVAGWLQEHETKQHTLPLLPLLAQSTEWRFEIVRAWCQRVSGKLPSEAQLQAFMQALIASEDRQPALQLAEWTMARYDKQIWLYQVDSDLPVQQDKYDLDKLLEPVEVAGHSFVLTADRTDDNNGCWQAQIAESSAIKLLSAAKNWTIQGTNQSQPRSIKRFLKERHIPPWLRDKAYVLCCDGVALLIATPAYFVPLKPADALSPKGNEAHCYVRVTPLGH